LVTQTFTVTTTAANGGAACTNPAPGATYTQQCPAGPTCNFDSDGACGGYWEDDDNCSSDCDSCSGVRTITWQQDSDETSSNCPPYPGYTQSYSCCGPVCPVDCVQSPWSQGQCSVSCGGGTITETRTILTHPNSEGVECEPSSRTFECNTSPCPINCVQSGWTAGVCSVTCGGGTMTETRTVLTPAADGGTACGVSSRPMPCNTAACSLPASAASLLQHPLSHSDCMEECTSDGQRHAAT